eukprot:3615984-Prymnesium_polylepis.1
MYTWEAYETDPRADLLQEGRDDADAMLADSKAADGKEKTSGPPAAASEGGARAWCVEGCCLWARGAEDAEGAGSRCWCSDVKALMFLRKLVIEWCGGGVSVARARGGGRRHE